MKITVEGEENATNSDNLDDDDTNDERNQPETSYKRRQRQRNNRNQRNERTNQASSSSNRNSDARRNNGNTILMQRQSLPIYELKGKLKNAIARNQALIVVGGTGSGKSTQITQYLAEFGYHATGMIGCTRPRKVAVMARRVAYEFGCKLGDEIGYKVRFENYTNSKTIIKYMSDDILLRESLTDPNLTNYSVIILDEAQDRTVSTDILFGLLKKVLLKRPQLKLLIVASTTLDSEKFIQYFVTAPVFEISACTFPVELFYSHTSDKDYVKASVEKVIDIHVQQPPGDILLFLTTGREEISTCCEELKRRIHSLNSRYKLIILPMYADLPKDKQAQAFEIAPKGSRKVIIMTDTAETSLKIDGISYVVDPGFTKHKVCEYKTGMNSFKETRISRASAEHRLSMAGRTGPGKCYRLYEEQVYNNMMPAPLPELKRLNIASIILLLKSMGIDDVLKFDLLDPPSEESVNMAMEQLYALSAVDSNGNLTELGQKMAAFPLDPNLSKILITSTDLMCSMEVLTIMSMLSVQGGFFYTPKGQNQLADEKKTQFQQDEGDLLSLLSMYENWCENDCSSDWCRNNFVKEKALQDAKEIRRQLLLCMNNYNLYIWSAGKNTERITKAICSGLFKNAAQWVTKNQYLTKDDSHVVFVHPSSVFFNRSQPRWVVCNEIMETKKKYMKDITAVDYDWLTEFTPKLKFCKSSVNDLLIDFSEESSATTSTTHSSSLFTLNNGPYTASALSSPSLLDQKPNERNIDNNLRKDFGDFVNVERPCTYNMAYTASVPSSSYQFNQQKMQSNVNNRQREYVDVGREVPGYNRVHVTHNVPIAPQPLQNNTRRKKHSKTEPLCTIS